MRQGKGDLPGNPGGCQDSSSSLIYLVSSGSVWSSYRKSCVDMVMKWLVPESSGRYVNRMTNEALHKGRKCPSWAGHLILPWIPGMLDVRSVLGSEWHPAMAGEAGEESLGSCLSLGLSGSS